jgi:hypothetical protein
VSSYGFQANGDFNKGGVFMKRKLLMTLALVLSLLLTLGIVQAQDDDEGQKRGTIQGLVYQDVNGDGRCVDTGVAGEGPVEGVNVEFVSSDKQTVITLHSGPGGIYGLFAAGQSYWAVTAKPSAEWIVTSPKTLYAPISDDNRVATGVNFCVQKANTAIIVLPVSGAAASSNWTALAALAGLGLVALGLGLEWRRQKAL